MLMRPLGLSFELAMPSASHANRTDIACFVGRVARRAAPPLQPPQRLPEILARWLEGEGIFRIADIALRDLWIDTSSVEGFSATLMDVLAAAIERAIRAAHAAETARFERERVGLAALFEEASASALGRLLEASRGLSTVPATILEDLRGRGFAPGALLGKDTLAGWLRLQMLTNVPVVLESFEQFDALFAWEARPVEASSQSTRSTVTTTLGAAVRAFFAEGGRRCYVVRTGDPIALFDEPEVRFSAIAPATSAGPWERPSADAMSALQAVPALPGIAPVVKLNLLASVTAALDPVPSDAARWVGAEHVFGLGEVCFLCLPDLVDACAEPMPKNEPPTQSPSVPETFRDCAPPAGDVPEPAGRSLTPPRLNSLGLDVWRACLLHAARLLANGERAFHRRDVQLIASLPLAGEGRDMPDPDGWVAWMDDNDWFRDSVRRPASGADDAPRIVLPALLDARIQLSYPWLRTRQSEDCPGGLEAPEGALCGVLARSALLQGSFRLAAHQRLLRTVDLHPVLDFSRATRGAVTTAIGNVTLADRVCLLAPSARGFEVASDVTCAGDPLLRPGSVRRLVDVVLRAARTLGEEIAFDANGEALWAQVRTRLSDLGRLLLAAGALSTDAGSRAFVVRCGRETMAQNDIDAGRLIAEVEMVPAQPVTRIAVVLALRDARPSGARRAA
jgi:hypothetical protein